MAEIGSQYRGNPWVRPVLPCGTLFLGQIVEFLVEKNLIFDCAFGPTKLYRSEAVWHTYKDNRFLNGSARPSESELNAALALTGPTSAFAYLEGDGNAVPRDTAVTIVPPESPTSLVKQSHRPDKRPIRLAPGVFAVPGSGSRSGKADIRGINGQVQGSMVPLP